MYHLTCLLRNLHAGQEATVRTRHGTTDWFQIGKGIHQGCVLSPCLFNLYAEYIMWHAGLDEAQAGIKIAGRNINNLRHAYDITLMAESEELKSLLIKVKAENEKVGLKLWAKRAFTVHADCRRIRTKGLLPSTLMFFLTLALLSTSLHTPKTRVSPSYHFYSLKF